MYAIECNFNNDKLGGFKNKLPRRLRRLQSVASRCFKYAQNLPNHFGSYATLTLFAGTIIYGTFAGNHATNILMLTTSTLGFAVDNVQISGNKYTSDIDVLDAIGLNGNTSLIGYDVKKIRQSLEKLPWISNVNVQKIYPNKLNIKITEYRPVAIWQHDNQISIINDEGNKIIDYQSGFKTQLPLVVGDGAQVHAAQFLTFMEDFSQIKSRIIAYIRVGDRRWDVLLDNGVRLKLPQDNIAKQLTYLIKIENENKILERDILSIDLRLEDRLTVALNDNAMKRRLDALKSASKNKQDRKAGKV